MNVNILLQQQKKKLLNIYGLKNNINRNFNFNLLLRCDATKNIHGDDIDDNGSNECCTIVYDEKTLLVEFCKQLNKYLQNKEQEKTKICKNNETVKKIRQRLSISSAIRSINSNINDNNKDGIELSKLNGYLWKLPDLNISTRCCECVFSEIDKTLFCLGGEFQNIVEYLQVDSKSTSPMKLLCKDNEIIKVITMMRMMTIIRIMRIIVRKMNGNRINSHLIWILIGVIHQ